MESTLLAAYLGGMLPGIPLTLALLAGILLPVIHWHRHPGVSLLTVIAFSTLLVLQLLGNFIGLWLTVNQSQLGLGPRELGFITMVIGFVSSIVAAIAYGFLLAAIFGWRSPAQLSAG